METFQFKAKVWVYPGAAGWHFVSLPKNLSKDVKKWYAGEVKGFGSLPVKVEIGKSLWQTSIFPDSKSGTYILPVKKAVRTKEGLAEGKSVLVSITIRV